MVLASGQTRGADAQETKRPYRLSDPTAMRCLVQLLERSGGYKVLSRLTVPTSPLPDDPRARIALFVDVETTGIDVSSDEIIELAIVPFSYDADGNVIAVHEAFDEFRDPGRPIPADVVRLTGIDDGMVRGKALDDGRVERLLSVANLVVAHNAAFDRPVLERLIPGFAQMPWACSIADVPWVEEGVTTTKLDVLAVRAGFFFDAHRAIEDCLAGVELLRRPLPVSGRIAMGALLRSARGETYRIVAAGAPFARKDALKARRYRWTPAGEGMAWSIEVPADYLDAELSFLSEEIYGHQVDLPVTRIDAYRRYSGRV